MKRKILSVFTAIILLLIAATLVSCSGKVSKEEAAAEVTRLVEESYELNVIYFGKGLPYEDDGDDKSLYAPVAEDAAFTTKEELIEGLGDFYQMFRNGDIELAIRTTM